jgi:hypothetical protein
MVRPNLDIDFKHLAEQIGAHYLARRAIGGDPSPR